MRRHTIAARPNWQSTVESQGLVYAGKYWDETVYYSFSLAEVEALEDVVAELHSMCLTAVDHVISAKRYADYGISDPRVIRLIEESRQQSGLYGRFDLRYDGDGPAKLLEYNADTPTSLVEAASVQWFWLEDLFPADDQWNSLHDRLVAAWRKRPLLDEMHFVYTEGDTSGEDLVTTACIASNFAYLASKNFYNDTRCHRAFDGMLQCGDPTIKPNAWSATDGQGLMGGVRSCSANVAGSRRTGVEVDRW